MTVAVLSHRVTVSLSAGEEVHELPGHDHTLVLAAGAVVGWVILGYALRGAAAAFDPLVSPGQGTATGMALAAWPEVRR
jgi:hypothetical protein